MAEDGGNLEEVPNAGALGPEPTKAIVHPEKFGDGDLAEWLQSYVICCRANGWRKDTGLKLLALPAYLTARAFSVYRRLPEERLRNYAEVKVALLEVFEPNTPEQRRLAERQFYSRKRGPGESLEEFARSLERLYNLAMPDTDAEGRNRQLTNRFVEAMPPNVAYQLDLALPKTFEQVLRRARELLLLGERLEEARKGTVAAVGHQESEVMELRHRLAVLEAHERAQETRGVTRMTALGVEGVRTEGAGAVGAAWYAAGRDEIRCYCCGGTGHTRRECPSRAREARMERGAWNGIGSGEARCYGCGEVGHFKRNCPSREQEARDGPCFLYMWPHGPPD
eukprot:m.284317 g.284317  ORF g.284317 m.284317 type:complete len:338 (+) comp40678_c0_seq26:633-1646(+)